MTRQFIFLVFLMLSSAIFAQAVPEWLWVNQSGGAGYETALSTVVDGQGNQYVTGFFENTAVFGSSSFQCLGFQDVFVAKFDRCGNCLWARQAGGEGQDWGCGIALDINGQVYITGRYSGTPNFGSYALPATYQYSTNIFVAKLDPSGNWLWASWAGGNGWNWGKSIAVMGNGCFVTGSNDNMTVFGTHPLNNRGIFVAKLDLNGSWIWASGGTCENSLGNAIIADAGGNCYLTGDFRGAASFWPTPDNGPMLYLYSNDPEYQDLFVAKTDTNGNWLWAVRAGGLGDSEYNDSGKGIGLDSAANVYVTGDFVSLADFGPYNLYSPDYTTDAFIAKLDTNGNWLWARRAGGTGEDRGNGLSVDGAGNCYITGNFQGPADFGSSLLDPGPNLSAIYAARLDSSGNWSWAVCAVTGDYYSGPLEANAIANDGAGNCFAVGWFNGTACFGSHNLTSTVTSSDVFIARLGFRPQSPANLAISVIGNNVLLTWDPVTVDTGGQPLIPEAYQVFSDASGNPEGPFDYLGQTDSTAYIHLNAVVGRDTRFYRVTALKE